MLAERAHHPGEIFSFVYMYLFCVSLIFKDVQSSGLFVLCPETERE